MERNKKTIHAYSGGAAKFITLAQGAKIVIAEKGYPDVIIGVSSGALLAPIVAASKYMPNILDDAIKFGETLDINDMFPYKGNKPFTKKGNVSSNAILRAATGHNHLGWQDIRPLYKKVFTEDAFKAFKASGIICHSFGVKGENFSPAMACLNNAKDIDDLIDMIELSARIVPLVQPAIYKQASYIDGGFIAHCAAWYAFKFYDIKELFTFYTSISNEYIDSNSNWDKDIVTIIFQLMGGMSHWLSYKDRIIEALYCKLNNIPYVCFEYPASAIDEIYETDSNQLKAAGEEAKIITKKLLIEYDSQANPFISNIVI